MNTIGLIGAGVMGLAAAQKILAAAQSLLIFDISSKALQRASSIGAEIAETLTAVAKKSEIVLMFLPGPEQVASCVAGPEGLLDAARPGIIIVDLSTIDPGTTQRMAELAKQKGVGYLDAPVLGRPSTVGRWALPVGGEVTHLKRCEPVLSLIAGKIVHVGSSGTGNKIKLLNQLMFSAINAMTAEMMAIAEKVGIAPRLLYETITASQAGTVSNLFIDLGKRIVAENYDPPTFSVDLLIKDVRLAIEMAQENGAPPLLARTTQYLNEIARAQGFGGKDTSIIWKALPPCWTRKE